MHRYGGAYGHSAGYNYGGLNGVHGGFYDVNRVGYGVSYGGYGVHRDVYAGHVGHVGYFRR